MGVYGSRHHMPTCSPVHGAPGTWWCLFSQTPLAHVPSTWPRRCTQFPEALYSRYMRRSGQVTGEIFFFEFGEQCSHALQQVVLSCGWLGALAALLTMLHATNLTCQLLPDMCCAAQGWPASGT